MNIVFFSKILKYSGLLTFSVFPRCARCVCIHTRQVEHQRCSRTCRVQKNHNILRKNTIFYEHPVFNLRTQSSNLKGEFTNFYQRKWKIISKKRNNFCQMKKIGHNKGAFFFMALMGMVPFSL